MVAMLSVAVTGSLAACGGSSSPASSSGAPADAALISGCRNNVAINDGFTAFFADLPTAGPPTDAVKQQLKADYDRLLAKPLAETAANPPTEIAADIKELYAGIQSTLGTSGDPSVLNDPKMQEKVRRVDLFYYDRCSGAKQAAGALEYAYNGLPTQLGSGTLNLKLDNTGKENHEILVVTRKAGVTETFDQVLALGREAGQQKFDVVAQVSASPGKPDATTVQLKPGEYLFFCTVRKGTIGDTQGSGPPHFKLGMKRQITIG